MDLLPHLALDTGDHPHYSIIWLHGLGADGGDFVPLAQEMLLPRAVRYIFPHAPMQPVTINGGYVMRAWYDIVSGDMGARQDDAGIRRSQREITKLITRERQRGIPPANIILAGFSQGGAIALHSGLRHTETLGGIIALSAYLPLADSVDNEASDASRQTAIFMAHGLQDPIVPYALGRRSGDRLSELGYMLEWHEYPMQHTLCMEEVRDIEAWLSRRINATPHNGS